MKQRDKSPAPLTAKDLAIAFKLDFLAGERFCFILGSGASRNSGIKTGLDMIGEWREELRKNYGGDMDSIRRAAERLHYAPKDWEPIFKDDYQPDSKHYFVMYDLMFARTVRAGYDFMEKAMAKAKPSIGYYCLASILSSPQNRSNLVITTNFDTLTEDALFFFSGKHPLVLGHERMASFLRSDTDRPIVAKIHRDMLLEPMSRQEEMKKLKEEWSKALRNVLPNCIPIVIGYAGGDNTLMDLLKDESLKCRKLYWCSHISQENLDADAAAVIANHGGEWVKIPGFDELLFHMANNLELVPSENELRASTEARIKQYQDTYKKFIDPILNPVSASDSKGASEQAEDIATAVLQEEARRNPDLAEYNALILQAWILWNTRDREAAIKKVTEAIQAFPDQAKAYEARSIMYHNSGRYPEALSDETMALKLEPKNAGFHHSRGVTLHEMKRFDESLKEKDEAIRLEPGNARFHHSRAVTLHKMKRFDEALKSKDEAIRLEPGNAVFHDSRSTTLHEMKRFDEALKATDEAIRLEPGNAKFHDSRSATLHKMKRFDEALKAEDEAIRLEPGNAEFHAGKAAILQDMGRIPEAEACIAKALRMGPETAYIRGTRSRILLRQGRVGEADLDADKAIALDPEHPIGYFAKSEVLYEKKQYPKALEHIDKALEIWPDFNDYLEHRKKILAAMSPDPSSGAPALTK